MSDGDSRESPARLKTESEFRESEEKERVSGKDHSHAIDISLVMSGAQVGW